MQIAKGVYRDLFGDGLTQITENDFFETLTERGIDVVYASLPRNIGGIQVTENGNSSFVVDLCLPRAMKIFVEARFLFLHQICALHPIDIYRLSGPLTLSSIMSPEKFAILCVFNLHDNPLWNSLQEQVEYDVLFHLPDFTHTRSR